MKPLQIFLIILTIVVGLGVGFFLRAKIVRRLRKTVLDAWLIQTLGVLVFLPSLFFASLIIQVIYTWSADTLGQYLGKFVVKYQNIDLPGLVGNIIETLIIIALGIGLARTMQSLTIRGLSEKRLDINMRTLIGRICYILTLVITLFWVLSIWNIAIGLPVAAIGIVTAAVVVSFQDVLKDLVAGLYILLERPFYIGNIISIATYLGQVEDVQIRTTKLRLMSGEEVSIPNSLIFGGTVINTSFYSERRATITVTVPEEHFVTVETAQTLIQTVKDVVGVMEKPEPTALFSGYAENKCTLTVHFWVPTQQNKTLSDVMYAVHTSIPCAELAVTEFAGNV